MAKNNIQDHWQRHDWQHTPFAPNLHIVQALVSGKTASGAGFTRYDALVRCHGETAEIMALNENESSEGLAAGPDFGFAAEHALAERLERWALWEWWHGKLPVQPIAAEEMIAKMRHGATQKRQTRLWYISGFPHIQVIIAQSRAVDGTQPILGFGADSDATKATQSALIELGLMELNLLAHGPRMQAYFSRLDTRSRTIFPHGPPYKAPPTCMGSPLAAELTNSGVKFTLQDRTPAGLGLSVVQAIIPDAPRWCGAAGPLL